MVSASPTSGKVRNATRIVNRVIIFNLLMHRAKTSQPWPGCDQTATDVRFAGLPEHRG
jgi:hypothetical protein